MHGEGMIHGDVKGVCSRIPPLVLYVHACGSPTPKANVMIDSDSHARLADFGLTSVIPDDKTFSTASGGGAGTLRWMSPELLDPDRFGLRGDATKGSDCYALGMTIYEVLSGHVPFFRFKNLVVIRKIIEGECPERPPGVWFTDGVWEILERCWKRETCERINAESVLSCLERTPPPLRPDANDHTGDKDPYTQWAHCEHIVSTDNMWP